jgi:hypothetical protein
MADVVQSTPVTRHRHRLEPAERYEGYSQTAPMFHLFRCIRVRDKRRCNVTRIVLCRTRVPGRSLSAAKAPNTNGGTGVPPGRCAICISYKEDSMADNTDQPLYRIWVRESVPDGGGTKTVKQEVHASGVMELDRLFGDSLIRHKRIGKEKVAPKRRKTEKPTPERARATQARQRAKSSAVRRAR